MTTMNSPSAPQKPKLLDRVREVVRSRHFSRNTEDAYVAWIKRFIFFHGKRHPMELGEPAVTRFLTSLAVDSRGSAATQNQALSALLFLYREILHSPSPGWTKSSTQSGPRDSLLFSPARKSRRSWPVPRERRG